MTEFRKGDKVEITRQGVVRRVWESGAEIAVDWDDGWSQTISTEGVTLVERAAPAIGDTITSQDELEALPVGAVVDPGTYYAIGVKSSIGWHRAHSSARSVPPSLPAKYVYQRTRPFEGVEL